MTLSQSNSTAATAVGQEQAYLDILYRLLDDARDRTERALAQAHGSGGAGGTFQARIEREVTAAEQARRLAQLNAVEHGLCFGRTDAAPAGAAPAEEGAGTLYIGRIGLRDEEHEPRLIHWCAPAAPAAPPPAAAPPEEGAGTLYIGRSGLRDEEHEPRLIDWRAPAAHPFYGATPKDPNGLIRRRHIYTRNRTVTGVDDEVFDLDQLSEPDRKS